MNTSIREVAPSQGSLLRTLKAKREAVMNEWYQTQFNAERVASFGVRTPSDTPAVLKDSFIRPLFDLLLLHLETGDDNALQVYRDERLRYAPHQADRATRRRFFAEILAPDEAALLAPLAEPEKAWLAQQLKRIHEPLLAEGAKSTLGVLALGDCLMNEIRVFLPSVASTAGIDVDMRCLYFSAQQGRGLALDNVLEMLRKFRADFIAMSFLSYEGIPHYSALLREAASLSASELEQRVESTLSVIRQFISELRTHTETPIILHDASGLPLEGYRRVVPLLDPISAPRRRVIDLLNEGLRSLAAASTKVLVLDEKAAAVAMGYRRAAAQVVPKAIRANAMFHTANFGAVLARDYADILRSYALLKKTKVLGVDFDNTLWEGVMAEGPVKHFTDRQNLLKQLRAAGILLVSVSKNDPSAIRWDEMVLKPEDFVLHKINWGLKVESLRTAADELDLGIDSFCLIDDNPVERDLVATELPKVATLDSTDPWTWRALERLMQFPNTQQTEEAKRRTEIYQEQVERKKAMTAPADYGALMASLKLRGTLRPAAKKDLRRVEELVLRTNQYNTTTRRYNRPELEQFLNSTTHRMYVGELADKFGDLGVVGVVIVKRDGERAIIDSFIMSCRAMGFQFEALMMRQAIALQDYAREIAGEFIPTERNNPASSLFADEGFTKSGETEWVLPAGAPRKETPTWFSAAS
jgi:FkbH-like protein